MKCNEIFKLLINRSTEKDESLKNLDKSSLDHLLDILGEASWKALQKDTGELLLNKVRKLKNLENWNFEILWVFQWLVQSQASQNLKSKFRDNFHFQGVVNLVISNPES